MKKLVSIAIIFLFLSSCSKKNDNSAKPPPVAMDTIHKTYLALGDSYTIGESVAASERFPVQTVKILRQQNIDIVDPNIIAVTGWTSGDLLNALNNDPPKNNYSIVTLLIGVNNQYQGKSLNEYKTEFTELLRRAVVYAGNNKAHVFVISIPDYSVTPFAQGSDTAEIAKEIDDFNAANRAITLSEGLAYIDITSISRDVKNDPSLVAGDGLHPSGEQYKKWSDLLAPVILQKIQ
ncbi:MAG TPA: SGNH/GDSL hydrolase family protein [Chitinophagaceae bacterium]|nr:SGNH/GDSL hydrolase family protein [Chitinophagaceae bacterium]